MFVESSTRSIIKALSWRIIATLTTTGLVFAVTGRFDLAITVGIFEAVAKMALYFGHERLWNRLNFGRTPVDQPLAASNNLAS
jgi:adenylylsulfate kinase